MTTKEEHKELRDEVMAAIDLIEQKEGQGGLARYLRKNIIFNFEDEEISVYDFRQDLLRQAGEFLREADSPKKRRLWKLWLKLNRLGNKVLRKYPFGELPVDIDIDKEYILSKEEKEELSEELESILRGE